MNVLVTGLWDISRDTLYDMWHRPFEVYLKQFSQLLDTDNNLIIFGDEDLQNYVFQRRNQFNTQFILRNLDWFRNKEYYQSIQKIRKNPEWLYQNNWINHSPQGALDLYNPIVMSKMFLMEEAIKKSKFDSDFFYWIDGGTRINTKYLSKSNIENISNETNFFFICFPYQTNTEIHGFNYQKIQEMTCCSPDLVARATFFGGNKKSIFKISPIYYDLMINSLNEGFMGTEESLFTILTYTKPELIDYYKLDYHYNGNPEGFFERFENERNIFKKMITKLPISIGILSWNSDKTLINTLNSYRRIGLLDMVNDVTILFQEVSERDKQIAEEFSISYIGVDKNIGIGKAFMILAENAKSDYVMILEHDWELIEKQEITYDRLLSGIKLIQDGYSSVRYRHRKSPGPPLFTEEPYKGNEINFYDKSTGLISPHLLDSIHWIDYPEQKFSDKIQKQNEYFITTSRWGNWTNNPCLYKKEFFLKTISQFIGTGVELESNISKWWAQQNFKVAHGEGLFTHNDIQKYGLMSSKKILIFYHLFIPEPTTTWVWWVDEQMSLLKSVGLTDTATVYMCITMPIGLVNNKNQSTFDELVIDYIKTEYPFVNIIEARNTQEQPNLYEGQTLKQLYECCKANDVYVLYFHNKGMNSYSTHIPNAIKDWRHYMQYFNIEKWKDCIQKLDEGYDCVGVNWLRGENLSGVDFEKEQNFLSNHFAGNFWWANAKYIRTLPDPLDPEKYCDVKWFMESMMTYRYAFEIWIGNLDTKYYCFHQSNTHHYFENYPREKYCKD